MYDINFNDLGEQQLPPDKRTPSMLAWVKSLLRPLSWNNSEQQAYYGGSPAPDYDPMNTYYRSEQVRYNRAVYESLIDNNTALPTDISAWYRTQANFIGTDERVKYNGQKLVFEWALNKWFGTTFRQPPGVPDIFTQNNAVEAGSFLVGITEGESSKVSPDGSTEFVGPNAVFAGQSNFTIYMPAAVFAALDPVSSNREAIVRNFADRYVPAGITYSISTY